MWTRQEVLRFQIIATTAICVAVLYAFGNVQLNWSEAVTPLTLNLIFLCTVAGLRYWNVTPAICRLLTAGSQLGLFGMAAAMLNVCLLVVNRPLIDATLMSVDNALGIRWLDLFAYLKGGQLGPLLPLIYTSHGTATMIVIIWLAMTDRVRELEVFTLAMMLATLGCLLFWAAFPSLGSVGYLVAQGEIASPLGAVVDYHYGVLMNDLWHGKVTQISLSQFAGLVAFPSMHTVFALLAAYSLRGTMMLFVPIVIWAALMLIAIPVDGGHHVIDVVGGALLTWASVLLAVKIVDRDHRTAAAPVLYRQPIFIPARRSTEGVGHMALPVVTIYSALRDLIARANAAVLTPEGRENHVRGQITDAGGCPGR